MIWNRLSNIFWLGWKELWSLRRDPVLVFLIVYAFSIAVYSRATGISHEVHNAPIGIVDEDRTQMSGRIIEAFLPPYFQKPVLISTKEINPGMDSARFVFVLVIPSGFEADLLARRQPTIQINIDATAVMQAGIGANYIRNILANEIRRFTNEGGQVVAEPVRLKARVAFNPNLNTRWFASILTVIDMVTILTIVLTAAAIIREREHGTVGHLLVMPLTPIEIMAAKIWPSALVILIGVGLSLTVMVQQILGVPIAGSIPLFLAGTTIYLFFAASMGIFLGTFARSMPQLGLLIILIVLPMNILSGGMTPIESQPEILQKITLLLASRHYVNFAQAILFRGAGFDIVWPSFAAVAGLGAVFLFAALIRFRASVSR